MKPCKECGKTVSTSAKQCPHCGKQYPTGGLTLPAKIFVGIVVLAALGQVVSNLPPPSSATTQQVTAPSVTVTAEDLFGQYHANEVSADAEYKNLRFQVTGKIAS